MGRLPRNVGPSFLLLSLTLHGVGIGAGAWLLASTLAARGSAVPAPASLTFVDLQTEPRMPLELPGMGSAGEPRTNPTPVRSTVRPVPERGGVRLAARPDLGRRGRGGTNTARDPALNLSDSLDGLTLNRDPMNQREESQTQRIRTSALRRSRDDRRSTPNPMELDFVASGSGALAEHHQVAPTDPASGKVWAGNPVALGGTPGAKAIQPDGLPTQVVGASSPGSEKSSPPMGIPSREVEGHSGISAAVTLARPLVMTGRAAVPSQQYGLPTDTTESTQRVATAVESLVHASTGGGLPGPGPGGELAPRSPGQGAVSGLGTQSQASGRGQGGDMGHDPRFFAYFGGMLRKVEPFWRGAFPSWAIAEGRGGLATIGMVVQRDGAVLDVHVVRGSGVPEFDQNLIAAVRRAAPYGPIPSDMGSAPLRVNLSFDATNPAVGRNGPGRGQRPQSAGSLLMPGPP